MDWLACMRELSLHILDAMQNSLEASATLIELTIEENLTTDRLTITIRDNGRGMSDEQLVRIFDPFFTTRSTRHVGLGIPLFKAAAERCGGDLTVTSQLGKGATLQAAFRHSHIDRAPLGNITGTLLAVILGQTCDVRYVHRVIGRQEGRGTRGQGHEEIREFEFDTTQIKAGLGDVPLTHPAVRKWLEEFIAEGESGLQEA
jgi:hypothetical protein